MQCMCGVVGVLVKCMCRMEGVLVQCVFRVQHLCSVYSG